jgi:glucokinase
MILAGDIGATHVRLAGFQTEGNQLRVVVERIYRSKDFEALAEIIAKFICEEGVPVERACFGVAGPVRAGRSKTSNLPWVIDSRELAKQLRLPAVGLINDLEAFAYGIDTLESKDFITLAEGAGQAEGNMAVISAGTGLGEAGMHWDGWRHRPFACEGGHTDFAPRNELELELLKYLLARHSHVSWERVLSGPGVMGIYEFLRDTHRAEEPGWLKEEMSGHPDPPALISRLALESKVPLCEQTLDIFVSAYGAEAGNCALKFLSTGGVFIGGSIAAKIVPKMQAPAFMEAFLAKGRMRPVLEDMPVKIVLNDSSGLFGAARCALIQKAFGTPSPA